MIIPNMYHTKIQVYSDSEYTTPSYNINIDGTAYIKVKLFDFNGDPVVGESVTLYYDDATSIYTGSTDGNGEISTSHTCSEWGIHTFSTKTQTTQVKVDGWKEHTGVTIARVYYNKDYVWIKFSVASTSFPTSFTGFEGQKLPASLSPTGSLVIPVASNSNCFILIDYAGNIQRRTYASTTQTNSLNAEAIFLRKTSIS